MIWRKVQVSRKIKIIALLLCVMMSLSLFACNENITETPTEESTTTAEKTTDEEVTTEEATTEGETTEEDTTEEVTTEEVTSEEVTTEEVTTEELTTEELTTEEATTEAETDPAPCDGDHEAKYDAKTHWREGCEEHGIKEVTPKAHQFNTDSGKYKCQVCGYTPECGGEHTVLVYLDASRHYVGPCEFCTFEGDPKEYEKHDFVGSDYICSGCGFDPECNGIHGKDNGDGTHTASACELCGARASDGAVPHENAQCDDTACDVCGALNVPIGPHICVEDENYVYMCTVCGKVPSCNGIHEYKYDKKGHIALACDKCGFGGGYDETHTLIEETEVVFGDTVSRFVCSVCGYVDSIREIPEYINKYIFPATLSASTGYLIDVSSVSDRDGTYYHAVKKGTGKDGTGQHIWLREQYVHPNKPGSGELAGGGSKFEENIDIGNAKYIVIKVRTNSLNDPVCIRLSTTGWNVEEAVAANPNATGGGSVASVISFKPRESDTWTTFAADLSSLGKFFAEDEGGGYIIDTFYLDQGSMFATSESYLDIGYIAFVEDLDDAKLLCDTPTLISIAADKSQTVLEVSNENSSEEVTAEEITEEESEEMTEEFNGEYSNGNGIGYAGADLSKDSFALKNHKIDESKAVSITASELLALLETKNGVKAGEVYRVTGALTLESDKTYYGNMAAIIASDGIIIKNISGTNARDMIISGCVIIENSVDINLYKLDIKGGEIGMSIDDKSSDISVSNSVISANDIAIDSKGACVSVYSSKLSANTGIVTAGTDFTVQNTVINAGRSGIMSSGRYFIAKNNTITVKDIENGIGIDMTRGSYNSMAALNVINNVQRSINVTDGYNCVVILNRAIIITASNNTNFYMIKNRLGGKIELKNNKYIIADENTFIEDGKDHPTVSEGNTEMNGDNITDITARSEYGVNEDLLPHTNEEQFVGMERRESVTDLRDSSSYNCNSYLTSASKRDRIVILPPGAYSAPSTLWIDSAHSNTDVYAYGAYVEGDKYDRLVQFNGAQSINFRGFTWGYSLPPAGQIHIVEKLGNNKLLAISSPGYPTGFGKLAGTVTTANGDEKIAFWSAGSVWREDGEHPYKSYNGYSIADNGDGTFTITLSNLNGVMAADEYADAQVGDVWTCRLEVARIESVRVVNSKSIHFKDVTCHGYGNATHWRNQTVEDISYERAHATPNAPFIIDKETYDKYVAYGEEYGVDFGVYIDEQGRYRGGIQRTGGTGTMEVQNATGGVNLTSCTLEAMFDDGSNQRGTLSRLAGYEKNADGSYTVYFKGSLSAVYHASEWSKVEKSEQTPGGTATVKEGDLLFAYASNGAVLFDGAIALEDAAAVSGADYHFAHTDANGDWSCDECGDKIFKSTTSYYQAENVKYDDATGKLTFDVDRAPAYQDKWGAIHYTAQIYSVKVSSEGFNEASLEGYDLCGNGCDPKNQFFFNNSSKNCPEFTFDNVLFRAGQARGVLVKTNDVTIKHCTFKDIGHQALKLGQETNWGEGTVPRNVVISNCLFDNNCLFYTKKYTSGYSTISIQGLGGAGGIYENVPLQETFACSNITIHHNKFVNTPTKYIMDAYGARDIIISENIFEEREGDGQLMYLNSCLNVTFKDNTYSERFVSYIEKNQIGRLFMAGNFKGFVFEGNAIPDRVVEQ